MFRALLCFAWVAAVVPAASAQEVADCSRTELSGVRTLCFEAEMPAGVADVWALWSESGQLATWMAPVAAMDMRPGGVMEAAYDPSGVIGDPNNILNRVVDVDPLHSFSIQVERAPPGFPHAAVVRELVTRIEFTPLSETSTRVRVSMSGYGDTQAFNELYAFFARGNAWTLQKLRERIVDGPVDWTEARQ